MSAGSMVNRRARMITHSVVGATAAADHKDDVRLSLFVAVYFVTQAANLTAKNVLPIPKTLYSAISIGFGAILGIGFAAAIRPMMRRAAALFITLECGWVCLYLMSLLMGKANQQLLLGNAVWTLGICTPVAVCAYAIRDKRVLYEAILKASYFDVAILSLAFFFPTQAVGYNMPFSYALVLPTLFHINEWYNTRRWTHLCLFMTESLAILLRGARGPLLCVAVMLALKFLLAVRKVSVRFAVVAVGSVLAAMFNLYFDRIGVLTLSLLEAIGYQSRTIQAIFQGSLARSPARIDLVRYYYGLASQRPLVGWGLLGGWIDSGSGPHNMLMEFLLAFGYPFGSLACLIAIALCFRVFFVKDRSLQDLLCIFVSLNSVMYLVSGDFLTSVPFFVFTLLCVSGWKFSVRGERGAPSGDHKAERAQSLPLEQGRKNLY